MEDNKLLKFKKEVFKFDAFAKCCNFSVVSQYFLVYMCIYVVYMENKPIWASVASRAPFNKYKIGDFSILLFKEVQTNGPTRRTDRPTNM